MSLASRLDHAKALVTTVHVTRARIVKEFETLCDAVGWEAAWVAVQADAQRVAQERQARGESNDGWIS